jgi:hypothetical protein
MMIDLISKHLTIFTVPTPTPTATATILGNEITAYLIFASLVVLSVLIIAVFHWGRKLITWPHYRDDIIANEVRALHARMREDLYEQAENEPLDPNDPPPDAFGPLKQLWADYIVEDNYRDRLEQPLPPLLKVNYPLEEDYLRDKIERDKAENQRIKDLKDCKEWEKRERARFVAMDKELKKDAKNKVEIRTPKGMDVSFLGGGWTFLLEFSTVIVIIFSLVILGFLGTLDGTQIAPILAAIAGYVLGKTASELGKGKEESGKAATDRAVAEIAAKKASDDKAAAEDAAKKAAEDRVVAEKTAEKAAADKSTAEEAADKATAEKAAAEDAAKKAAEDRAAAEKAARKAKNG